MRPLICFLLVTFPMGPLPAQIPSPTPTASSSFTSITAAFWNVQWFPGRRPNATRTEETRQIRSVQHDVAQLAPDVLALEEIRDAENAQLAIRPLTGFKVDVCSNFPIREGQTDSQQIAITSRLRPIAAWAERWKRSSALLPPRGFAFAAYQVAPHHITLVYALHLKSNRGEIHEDMRIREESIRQLLGHIQAMSGRYGKDDTITWMVGGDFNTAPDEPRFAKERTIQSLIRAGFNWTGQGVPMSSRITMPTDFRYPPAAFDHVFFRNATLSRAWVAPTSSQSSDHRAVSATLNLP